MMRLWIIARKTLIEQHHLEIESRQNVDNSTVKFKLTADLLLTIEVDKQLSSSSYSSWRPLGAAKDLLSYQVSFISTVKISKFNQRRMSFDLNDLKKDSAK